MNTENPKVIKTVSSYDPVQQFADELIGDPKDPDSDMRPSTADAFIKGIREFGSFKNIDGENYISVSSLAQGLRFVIDDQSQKISDGSHTFDELYNHRSMLFLCLMSMVADYGTDALGVTRAWWSDKHSDGSMFDNYIIVGLDTNLGECTYHVKDSPYGDILRAMLVESNIEKLDFAPEWDGHNSDDVLKRLAGTFLAANTIAGYLG